MNPRLLLIGLAVWYGLASQAGACEPCASELDFDETARAAELIVVGQRTDYDPGEKKRRFLQEGPDTITVKILQVIKGRIEQEMLTVNSWDAMCDYGITADDLLYVMLLQRRGEMYDAVNYGCAVKTLLVDGGQVEVNGQRLSLEALKAYLEALATRGG